jgi:PAS domain S-box-containing protein
MHKSLEELVRIGFREAPLALLVLSNRKILIANHAVERVFGWTREELAGQSIRTLYPTVFDYEATGARWLRWLQSQPRYQDERFMQARSGEIFWTRATGVTLTPKTPFELMVWSFEKLADVTLTATLTPREREIASHIANGRTCKEIGGLLGISHRTVEVHRAAIMRKLGASNTAELVSKIIVIH